MAQTAGGIGRSPDRLEPAVRDLFPDRRDRLGDGGAAIRQPPLQTPARV